MGHGIFFKIFDIWNSRLLRNPLWKLICGLLGWVPTGASYIWPSVFLDMSLFSTLVTSHIWFERWTSSRATVISTMAALEVNLLKSLVYWLLNGHSVCLQNWRLVLRLFFAVSQLTPIWINKIVVFMCRLLYKGLIGYDLLLWHEIQVTHTKFLDKLRNLLLLLKSPNTESGVINILEDASDAP